MKTTTTIALLFFALSGFAQDSMQPMPLKTQIFSLSPISKKVSDVNGLVFGVGHYANENITSRQTINGLNAEISPAALMAIFLIGEKVQGSPTDTTNVIAHLKLPAMLRVNGLNISTGGFTTDTEMNGLNISTFSIMKNMNGLSISGGLMAEKANGISVCGVLSSADELHGASIAFINGGTDIRGLQLGCFNNTHLLKGFQIGLFNNVQEKSRGVQVGFINRSRGKGFQIGLLNINEKRTLPLINW